MSSRSRQTWHAPPFRLISFFESDEVLYSLETTTHLIPQDRSWREGRRQILVLIDLTFLESIDIIPPLNSSHVTV